MNIPALLLALLPQVASAADPITQAEARAYHATGGCSMMQPGTGLRADGKGWIVSPLPGLHRITLGNASVLLDMEPGRPYRITAPPGAKVEWCTPMQLAGRARCGAVPPALLWSAHTVGG